MKRLRIARITPPELKALLEGTEMPIVLDVRTGSSRKRDPRRIPTAIVASADTLGEQLESVPLDSDIILYCT